MKKTKKSAKIKSFTGLRARQRGHTLVLDVYKVTREKFPKEELFGLTSQIRRAIVSYTSNIAEGFSRKGKKEKIQFYSTALGSLTEVQNQLLIARDIEYISDAQFTKLADQTVEISKMTNGLIKSASTRNT